MFTLSSCTLPTVDTGSGGEHRDPTLYTSKEQQALMDEMDRRKRARELAVPTDDRQIRARLQELQEPQCLFGEGVSEVAAHKRAIMRLFWSYWPIPLLILDYTH